MKILYRHEALVAVYKPAGILVHRTALSRERDVVLQRVRNQLGTRVYPVHRLDRATSGVLLFALDEGTAHALSQQFARGEVNKTYLALVRGFTDSEGEILTPIRDDGGVPREARTRFRQIQTTCLPISSGKYPEARFSLLSVFPETGRRHQIRRHLARIAHPIVGDTSHGDSTINRFQKTHAGIGRLMLHAHELVFTDPHLDRRLTVSAAPDDEFRSLLEAMGCTAGS